MGEGVECKGITTCCGTDDAVRFSSGFTLKSTLVFMICSRYDTVVNVFDLRS